MADNRTKEQRSYNMSRIRSRDTKPELVVRRFLFANGIRYRLHRKDLLGHPDIVISRQSAVVFIHGCFWHGHTNCKYAKIPKSNKDFWQRKILANRGRDEKITRSLKNAGWSVFVIWECQLTPRTLDTTLNHLLNDLLGKNFFSGL
jgi:DNA mismatch endonuclease, patch repair protein